MIFNLQNFGFGFISGFVTGVVARELGSVSGSALRPMVKAMMKTGVIAVQKARESMAHIGETIDDIMAEVSAETGVQPESATAVPKAKKVSGTHRPVAEADA